MKSFVDDLLSHHIPTNVKDVLRDHRWVQAMKKEIEALLNIDMGTRLTIRRKKTVGCKWAFSINTKQMGP